MENTNVECFLWRELWVFSSSSFLFGNKSSGYSTSRYKKIKLFSPIPKDLRLQSVCSEVTVCRLAILSNSCYILLKVICFVPILSEISIYIYLEHKWPFFWFEEAYFVGCNPQNKGQTGSKDFQGIFTRPIWWRTVSLAGPSETAVGQAGFNHSHAQKQLDYTSKNQISNITFPYISIII